ncbi:MAG: carbohydrate kinase family protein [Armatimonadota bacterium]
MSRVIVAGHLCLDIIPTFLTDNPAEPGQLVDTGESILSTGGAVSNVGLALHKLGAEVTLVARIGEDAFGNAIRERMQGLDQYLIRTPHGQTSHSIVISQPGRDRTFLHHAGTNHLFGSGDLDFTNLPKADWLHFGYPPLMRRMYADGGDELADIFRRAKAAGLRTSLDMSQPDWKGESGKAHWPSILKKVLPHVDFFMPSEGEAHAVTDSNNPLEAAFKLGANQLILKCGGDGLFWWDGKKGHRQPIFPVEVVGTTGSGDATIAGFIFGMTNGYSIEESMRIGCAVGACCCEAADAVSGVTSWEVTRKRFEL